MGVEGLEPQVYSCPNCDADIAITEADREKPGACPDCQQPFTVATDAEFDGKWKDLTALLPLPWKVKGSRGFTFEFKRVGNTSVAFIRYQDGERDLVPVQYLYPAMFDSAEPPPPTGLKGDGPWARAGAGREK